MKITRRQLQLLIQEEIRQVRPGCFKVYPKKPKRGKKRRKALSKNCKTKAAAKKHLAAIEISKSMNESKLFLNEVRDYSAHTTQEIVAAVDRSFEILDIQDESLKKLMIRIARTESGGDDSLKGGEINGHSSNPFQLDDGKAAIENVKTNVNMKRWRKFFNDKKGPSPSNLGDPIEAQKYSEIIANVSLSALFATLEMLWASKNWDPAKRKSIKNIPPSSDLKKQSEFWKLHYNTSSGDGKKEDFTSKNPLNIIKELKEPSSGTGKKPKGSSRRLYTDENPKDTVSVKFRTKTDIQDTLSKKSFKSKPHNRQSQIINLIHQRVRAAYQNAKDPATKKRLKRAYDYAKERKEASKRKTQRMGKNK